MSVCACASVYFGFCWARFGCVRGLVCVCAPPPLPCGLLPPRCGGSLSGKARMCRHLVRCLPPAELHPLLPPPLHVPDHLCLLHPLWVRHAHRWALDLGLRRRPPLLPPSFPSTPSGFPSPVPLPSTSFSFFTPHLRCLPPPFPYGLPLALAGRRLLFLRRLTRVTVHLLHLA